MWMSPSIRMARRLPWQKSLLHGEVELRDLDTGQLLGGKGGDRIAFSPDGKWMATANALMWDKTGKKMTPGNPIKIWDATSLIEMTELRGHFGLVFQIAFSKEAGKLASAGEDKTVRLWDVASSKELYVFKGHTNQVMSVAFSPDGNRLASASQDKTVKIWDTQTGQMLITLRHEVAGSWGPRAVGRGFQSGWPLDRGKLTGRHHQPLGWPEHRGSIERPTPVTFRRIVDEH